MTTHITKTWVEDGKLITQVFEEKDIYKREWVGLTDEDKVSLCSQFPLSLTYKQINTIEAKLKDKNGF